MTPSQQSREHRDEGHAADIRDRLYRAIRDAQSEKMHGEIGVRVFIQDGVVQGSRDLLEISHKT